MQCFKMLIILIFFINDFIAKETQLSLFTSIQSKVFVLGGTGFLGYYTTMELLARGYA